jgi:hypothetical protein
MVRAIEIHKNHVDADHPTLAVNYSNLAGIHWELGELKEAREWMALAIEIEEKNFSPEHPTLAVSYSNAAQLELSSSNCRMETWIGHAHCSGARWQFFGRISRPHIRTFSRYPERWQHVVEQMSEPASFSSDHDPSARYACECYLGLRRRFVVWPIRMDRAVTHHAGPLGQVVA